jgi:hypothetical protein
VTRQRWLTISAGRSTSTPTASPSCHAFYCEFGSSQSSQPEMDQVLLTARGAERLGTYPYDATLLG